MMTTMVVGPFYLARALGLSAAGVGIIMSVGPLGAAMTGVPGGRSVDRFGAQRITIVGLLVMATGCVALATVAAALGIAGYVIPLVVVTAGYALFQAANNSAAMTDIRPDQRGVISGMLNLSRNLGLITGAAVMGAVFARAAGTLDMATARAGDVAIGMRTTFAAAALLILLALVIAARPYLLTRLPGGEPRRSWPRRPPLFGLPPDGVDTGREAAPVASPHRSLDNHR
jgi:MFS family permease